MKRLYSLLLATIIMLMVSRIAFALPDGFHLPDSIKEMSLHYRSVNNLIILPVTINDSITVNLILDTGCRNLVLFGKKFTHLMKFSNSRPVKFSGLGAGKPVQGQLSLQNKIAIHQVLGEKITVVVVPSKNVLANYRNVDGVIGFELFLKFEIEINPSQKIIRFRPAHQSVVPENFHVVPLRIVDSRPVMDSQVKLSDERLRLCELMIDTGSNLGLLMKTTEMDQFTSRNRQLIGFGFNGEVSGISTMSEEVHLNGFMLRDLPTGIIESPWHNYASIGMDVLRDYVIIINYFKLYACFRKNELIG